MESMFIPGATLTRSLRPPPTLHASWLRQATCDPSSKAQLPIARALSHPPPLADPAIASTSAPRLRRHQRTQRLCLPSTHARFGPQLPFVASAASSRNTTAAAVNLTEEEHQADSVSRPGEARGESNGSARADRGDGGGEVDVVLLGNLCVDVLVDVQELPASTREEKWAYMQKLKAQPPDETKWEAGGCLNFGIAAARLGLRCSAYGFTGEDMFGSFLERVLSAEGLRLEKLTEEQVGGALGGAEDGYLGETWVCWVLIDPKGKHMFASPFDFNKWAAFSRVHELPAHAQRLVKGAQSLMVNGFAFDEFRPEVVQAAAEAAHSGGGAVFFDPGPRTRSLSSPDGVAKAAFDWLVRESEVLLLTSDEAEVITGHSDPEVSAQMLLEAGGPRRQWVGVKRGPEGCVLATAKDGLFAIPGFQVDVADTVGCGDSFAAAIALGFIRGEHPATALALANAVGAATATRSGAGRNVAAAPRVAEILLGLQAREEGWHDGNSEDWDAEVWLEDKGKKFRVGHVGVHGAATCPSGTPLVESVREAARLLHDSISIARGLRVRA